MELLRYRAGSIARRQIWLPAVKRALATSKAEPTVEGGQAKLERGPPAVGGLRPSVREPPLAPGVQSSARWFDGGRDGAVSERHEGRVHSQITISALLPALLQDLRPLRSGRTRISFPIAHAGTRHCGVSLPLEAWCTAAGHKGPLSGILPTSQRHPPHLEPE
jgi:hypothetical protein